ncbi:MAG: NifB/NifX family molybdenum-iron cluster-binding protein [Thermodesulfobacteriota bacterium]|nr:NifB/NifX family molybdenum-iron cluster-binding protein [Thermodesulfobacteriota bacterium]
MKKMILISLAILVFYPVMVNAAELENMKIAVAADSKSIKDSVSKIAAKCPYYLIFNNEGKLIEVVDNPYKDASRNAGPSAANFLAQRSIDTLVAESFGSKMIDALRNNGKTHFEFKGSVDDAVKRVLKLN